MITPVEKRKSIEDYISKLTLKEIVGDYGHPKNLPGYVRISLLEDCNERCFFCHNEGYPKSRNKVANPTLVKKIIDNSLKLGKNKFKFTGGEPTLEKKLCDYISYIHSKTNYGNVGIVTNGTTLSTLAEPLYQSGMKSLIVSLHSLNREQYKKITKLDALEDVLKGLDKLEKIGFKNVTINTIVSSQNIHEIDDIIQFSKERGYEIRLLDILTHKISLDKTSINYEELNKRFFNLAKIKPKIYHSKCLNCSSKKNCGEEDYLRFSANGTLDPCLYRLDLKIPVNLSNTNKTMAKKMALGFRRIEKDDL
jgi:cyclic pyranopterin phosphate synthase